MRYHGEVEETGFDALVSFYVAGMGSVVRSAERDRSKVTGIGGIATQVITVITFLNYEYLVRILHIFDTNVSFFFPFIIIFFFPQ